MKISHGVIVLFACLILLSLSFTFSGYMTQPFHLIGWIIFWVCFIAIPPLLLIIRSSFLLKSGLMFLFIALFVFLCSELANISQKIAPNMAEYFKGRAGGSGLFIAILSPYWVLPAWIFLIIGIIEKVVKKKSKPIVNIVVASNNSTDYFICPTCGKGYDESWKVCLDCRTSLNKNPNYTHITNTDAVTHNSI